MPCLSTRSRGRVYNHNLPERRTQVTNALDKAFAAALKQHSMSTARAQKTIRSRILCPLLWVDALLILLQLNSDRSLSDACAVRCSTPILERG